MQLFKCYNISLDKSMLITKHHNIILKNQAFNSRWFIEIAGFFLHFISIFLQYMYFVWNFNFLKSYSRMPFANSLRSLRWPKRNGKTQLQWFRHEISKLWWNYRWPIPGHSMKSNQCEHCIFNLYVQQFLCNFCCFCLS